MRALPRACASVKQWCVGAQRRWARPPRSRRRLRTASRAPCRCIGVRRRTMVAPRSRCAVRVRPCCFHEAQGHAYMNTHTCAVALTQLPRVVDSAPTLLPVLNARVGYACCACLQRRPLHLERRQTRACFIANRQSSHNSNASKNSFCLCLEQGSSQSVIAPKARHHTGPTPTAHVGVDAYPARTHTAAGACKSKCTMEEGKSDGWARCHVRCRAVN